MKIAIYYPSFWIGFSLMCKDMDRSWFEMRCSNNYISFRFGEAMYSVSMKTWRPFFTRTEWRNLRKVKQIPVDISKKIIREKIHYNKPVIVQNCPPISWAWITGHFRTWPYQYYEHERQQIRTAN
jgi:hypothetical protein